LGLVGEEAPGQIFLQVLQFFPVSIIPPLFHINPVTPAAIPQPRSLTPS
jgi:hypothetical protein